jgi:hypothetical protein
VSKAPVKYQSASAPLAWKDLLAPTVHNIAASTTPAMAEEGQFLAEFPEEAEFSLENSY